MRFLLKRGARGAKTISKGYALVAICCVTKYVSYYLMEDIQKVDIEMVMVEVEHSDRTEIGNIMERAGYREHKRFGLQDVVYVKR